MVAIGALFLLLVGGKLSRIVADDQNGAPEISLGIPSPVNDSLDRTLLEALEEYYDEPGEEYVIPDYESFSEYQQDEVQQKSEGVIIDLDADEDDETVSKEELEFMKKARWSYAPAFVEKLCRDKCRENDKPFGRLLGTRCQCLCPLNAPDLGLCNLSGSCDKYCSSLGYFKGGDCVYNGVCFCYCKKSDKYDPKRVYT